jgi:tRNA-2-methylthio-N6-dimethylallyladenosine synthase
MNDLDAEHMDGLLRAAGWTRVAEFEDAQAIIINTCAVRGGAEDRAMGRVASLKALKSAGRAPVVVLAGCVAQKDGEALLERFPHLDIVVGTRDWPHLASLIERARAGERLVATDGIAAPLKRPANAERVSRIKAFVEIMIGCDNFCSYCVVPATRGREVSRSHRDVIGELEGLARDGYKEVTLIGQNVNSYRDGDTRFADLLRLVDRIEGLERVRFLTSHPKDLSDDLIEAMASCAKVCESLHLPAQAGSDRILEKMNRRYTRAHYETLVSKLRAAMPELVLSTDLIVGFPTETEEDFEQTLAMQETVRWDSAFTFMYSPREGTVAYAMADDVAPEEKQRRVAELIRRQEANALAINERMIGRRFEVLVENISSRNATELIGRTRGDKPVVFPGDVGQIGRLATVEIAAASPHTLRGVPA